LRFRRTTLLTLLYMTFLGGVGLAYAGHSIAVNYVWFAGVLLIVFRKRTIVTLALVVVLGLGVGLWRGALFMQKLAAYEPYYDQKVTLTAQAMTDATYGKTGQLSFDANRIYLEDGTLLTGKIQLSGFGLNSVYQGDEVQASGTLRPGVGAYQGRISYAQMILVDHHPSLVAEIRRRFAAGMQSALPEPLAPFAMGLLIGQRATLPEDNKQELMMVGLTHIIAVSGYNLTIILQASKKVLGKASKRIATFLALALIAVFLLVTGGSASIVRAAIVSVLSIAAAYYGRTFKPVNLLMLAAVITVWANPVYIWSDISWYLSFLAFYGVMVVSPAVSQRVQPGRELPLVLAVALESLAAEAMTLPYVLHTFGQMSFVGLPANVLVVTMIPLAMLLGVIAGLGGMLIAPLAGWLAWPAKLLLTYMLDVAHILSSLPHIFVENIGFSFGQMLLCYAVVIAVSSSLRFKAKSENGTITDKKPITPRGIGT
jgi:competence protein ComEC